MLQRAARGEQELTADALTGLLADHLLAADGQARELAQHRAVLLEMITTDAKKQPANLLAALDAIAKIDSLERSSLSELRKTTELAWRMSSPARPKLEVVAADKRRVSVSSRSS